MTTTLDPTTFDPTAASVDAPVAAPPVPPAATGRWSRCTLARIVVPVAVAALVLGGLGGLIAGRVSNDPTHPAVEAQGGGDVLDNEAAFDDSAPDDSAPDDTAVDAGHVDESVTDEVFTDATGDATPYSAEHAGSDNSSLERPDPAKERGDDPVVTPESPSRPEPANQAPTFEHVTVSTRSHRAWASSVAKDGDGTIARVVIDWGDGSAVQVLEPPTPTAEHRYDPVLGNRYRTVVNVTAYDDKGAFVSASRAVEVVALHRVQVGELRLIPRSDCFDVLVDLRLAGKATIGGAIKAGSDFRETLRNGQSAVVLPASRSEERPVDEGFALTTNLLVDSAVHAPVAVRKTITGPGKYSMLVRLVHDDDNTKKCSIDATFAVTTAAV